MKTLVILWTTAEKETALKMIFPYAKNSILQAWWANVTIIVWGASVQQLANDIDLQTEIKQLQNIGIKIQSCKWCVEEFGVTEKIEELGIDNRYMGEVLTKHIQNDEKLITF